MPKRVVITGLGIISPNAIGREAFFEAIIGGVSGIKPVSLFDTESFKVKTAGEVKDFRPEDFLGLKGLRTLDRSIKLVNSAAKLALDDSRLEITEENSTAIGVSIASTLGSVSSISEFDKESLREGPHYVNPALFPNTVINSPASQISIKFNIRGFNATLATGFSASLDAINYAVNFIRLGRVKAVLAGGVEELCLHIFLSFYKTGWLAGLKEGAPELSCPFDQRRNGIIFGEGASVLVLEDLDSALARQANIYAEVLGFGMGLGEQDGLKKAMQRALEKAKISPEEIDYISASANSTPEADLLETKAIKDVFAKTQDKVYISAVKSMLGESFSASGAMQIAASLAALERQTIPPTINYREKDPRCNLNYVVNEAKENRINKVLINAFNLKINNSSLILGKFSG